MKILVLGEFKELGEMEKLVWVSSVDYLVLGDLESLEKEDEILQSFESLVLHLKRYETFQRYYPFIQRFKERMVLWVRGREVRKYEEFFRNSGYATTRSLSGLERKIKAPRRKESSKGRVLGVCNSFGVAMELACHQGRDRQVIVVDLALKRPPSGYRLGIDPSKPRKYLSETYDFESLHRLNGYGNFHVIGYPGHQEGDPKPLEEEFVKRAGEDFDLLVLSEPARLDPGLMDRILYAGTLDHESVEGFLKKGLPREKTVFLAVYEKKGLGDYWYLKKQLGGYAFKMVRSNEIYNFKRPFELINLEAVSPKSALAGILKVMVHE